MRLPTVKGRIFRSNTMMMMVTLLIFFVINVAVVRIYSESIEYEFETTLRGVEDDESVVKEIIEDFTRHKNKFIVLFLADGSLCIGALLIVSQIFTRNLAEHIMEPLDILAEGAERIRSQDLTRDIAYEGDLEFANVCRAFNDMRRAILAEQEKNRKYEKARTDMIAGISHDLRTPLTAVRGTIKGLLDGVADTPDRRDRFLETAYRRTGEMDALLNQLFYFSRLETGNMPLKLESMDLSDFIRSYVLGKRELLENEPITIDADLGQGAEPVSADVIQLQRVFDNLLENSRKYAGVSPLEIHIRLYAAEETTGICFSDNGTGVPEESLDCIFDEFYRVDESRNKKEGNGLGMYIVRYLIEAMGGSVRAENAGGLAVYMEWKKGGC